MAALPSTLDIDRTTDAHAMLLVFTVGDLRCALHLRQVQSVVRAVEVTPVPLAPSIVIGVIDIRGQVAPVFDIRGRFGLRPREIGLDDQFIIAHASDRTIAIVVDSVQGIIRRSVETSATLQCITAKNGPIEGIAQLDEGITVISDLGRFLSMEEEWTLQQALAARGSHAN
ncbi:MAG TPA: chemotaxis protein CheW [Tepidisphaeraceae bacterium]|nr:chemotaxis protein CheW [Tepidisphaeraceae bacterium]